MSEYKCPRCKKELTDDELKDKICFECGCLFGSVDYYSRKVNKHSGIIKDTRTINYRHYIKFFIFCLILWSIITCIVICATTFVGIIRGDWWAWVILIAAIISYAIVFLITQFLINVIRDVYILKKKLSVDEKRNKKK